MLNGFQRVKLCHHPKLLHMELPGPKAIPLPLPAASLLPPFGAWGGGWEGKTLCGSQGSEKFLKILFWRQRQGKPPREVKIHEKVYWSTQGVLKVIAPSHFSCEGTNATLRVSVLFQTNKFKHVLVHGDSRLQIQERFSPAITAQLEAAPNPGAPRSFSARSWSTTEPCRHSCQFPTEAEVWGFAWHPPLFEGLVMTFLCLPPPSTTLQFLWKQPPDWGTQRQRFFLETNSSRGVESNHK